jgi:hypothetical protein
MPLSFAVPLYFLQATRKSLKECSENFIFASFTTRNILVILQFLLKSHNTDGHLARRNILFCSHHWFNSLNVHLSQKWFGQILYCRLKHSFYVASNISFSPPFLETIKLKEENEPGLFRYAYFLIYLIFRRQNFAHCREVGENYIMRSIITCTLLQV